MTLKAGTNLNLSPYCDKILEFFYFRKNNDLINTDIVDQELSLPYEQTELAIKKLENDGFLKVVETSDAILAQITKEGEIHYRTSSYKKELNKEISNSRKENFRFIKDVIQLLTFIFAILIAINTLSLNKDFENIKKDIKVINKKNSEIDSLKNEIELIKSELKSNQTKNNIPAKNK